MSVRLCSGQAVDNPSVFCDNYDQCGGLYLGRGNLDKTKQAARARGWHFFEGKNMLGSKTLDVSLCPACTQSERRALPKAGAPLEGQEELWP